MRPLIGITAWKRRLDTYLGKDTLQTLSAYYTDSVISAGMTPMILPGAGDPGEADRIVGLVDGLILSGGDDIDPAVYGATPTFSKGYDPDVDRFEIALVQAARSQGKPLLAICRGLQLLNVALGGTLRQEVNSAGAVHDLITKETDPEELNARRHVVQFEPDSFLAPLYGSEEAKVNTLHHQGIDGLASELVVEGRSEDGLIEAVRFDGDWWALGVQWHPERMDGDHQRVFEALREAVENA